MGSACALRVLVRSGQSWQDLPVGDPVSWLLIRPGWKVYASDGTEVGEVDEIAGDDQEDLFDGLAIARSALAKPTYVPAESVGPIPEGRLELTLTKDKVDGPGD